MINIQEYTWLRGWVLVFMMLRSRVQYQQCTKFFEKTAKTAISEDSSCHQPSNKNLIKI